MDNPTPEVQDNVATQESEVTPAAAGVVEAPAFSWKNQLTPDLKNSPALQKFDDSPEGLKKAVESHLSLEKLLGHDKVPIPKDANDVEGWNKFSKAMGVPDKAEGYGLPDASLPEGMKNLTFDKNRFAETVHAFKLTPSQAKGLWDAYTKMSMEAYNKYQKDFQEGLTKTVNQLRSEWGDAYDSNVDLGQMVINKFSADQDMNDYLTATLTKDPRGVKFLAKIGNNFAENKVGDFAYQNFSLSPEQAQGEIDKILADPKHPYNNERASQAERDRAIDYVNSLYLTRSKGNYQK